jgi:hypothetical protein
MRNWDSTGPLPNFVRMDSFSSFRHALPFLRNMNGAIQHGRFPQAVCAPRMPRRGAKIASRMHCRRAVTPSQAGSTGHESRVTDHAILIGTRMQTGFRVSHRKQRTGTNSNRYTKRGSLESFSSRFLPLGRAASASAFKINRHTPAIRIPRNSLIQKEKTFSNRNNNWPFLPEAAIAAGRGLQRIRAARFEMKRWLSQAPSNQLDGKTRDRRAAGNAVASYRAGESKGRRAGLIPWSGVRASHGASGPRVNFKSGGGVPISHESRHDDLELRQETLLSSCSCWNAVLAARICRGKIFQFYLGKGR